MLWKLVAVNITELFHKLCREAILRHYTATALREVDLLLIRQVKGGTCKRLHRCEATIISALNPER